MGIREQAMNALLGLLSPGFKTAGRRLVDPENLDPSATPALFLIEHEDVVDRSGGFNVDAKKIMWARALLYYDAGADQTIVPSTEINNRLDDIDTMLTPPVNSFNAVTLGGLVQAVTIDGTIERASGDVSGKALAVVPIRILLP